MPATWVTPTCCASGSTDAWASNAHGPGTQLAARAAGAFSGLRPWPLFLTEKANDRRLERPCYPPLEASRRQQPGVGRVAHVSALDQHLGNAGEGEPGQVVPGLDSVHAVVGTLRHRRPGQQGAPDITAETRR